jgi:hypothetical protein
MRRFLQSFDLLSVFYVAIKRICQNISTASRSNVCKLIQKRFNHDRKSNTNLNFAKLLIFLLTLRDHLSCHQSITREGRVDSKLKHMLRLPAILIHVPTTGSMPHGASKPSSFSRLRGFLVTGDVRNQLASFSCEARPVGRSWSVLSRGQSHV